LARKKNSKEAVNRKRSKNQGILSGNHAIRRNSSPTQPRTSSKRDHHTRPIKPTLASRPAPSDHHQNRNGAPHPQRDQHPNPATKSVEIASPESVFIPGGNPSTLPIRYTSMQIDKQRKTIPSRISRLERSTKEAEMRSSSACR